MKTKNETCDHMKPLRYFAYLRKSTDAEDRQVQSIEDQKRELDRLSLSLGLTVVGTFQESRSAKSPGRLEFNKMLSEIKEGKAEGILCWKINRLSRNPVDGGALQWLLQKGILQSIQTPGREYKTGDNVLMMSVELGMANQFVLDLSKDVTRGMLSKAEKGWRPGIAPIGYTNDRYADKGSKKILVDKEKFPLVRKLWDLMLTGNYSVARIHRIANDEMGLRTQYHKREKRISVSHIYRIFSNPFYYGEFDYMGQTFRGQHAPMITVEEFDRVQKLIGNKGRTRPKTKHLPFAGMIRCGTCGRVIVPDEKTKYLKKSGGTKKYLYYRCMHHKQGVSCAEKQISGEKLEEQILSILDTISIPDSFLSFALNILKRDHILESNDRKTILKNQQRAFAECVKKIDTLVDLYISPQNEEKALLSEEEFLTRKTALLKERERLNGELESFNEKMDECLELTEKTFHFATYVKEHFKMGDVETRTKILHALGSNFLLKEGKLAIELIEPLRIISEGVGNIYAELRAVEPSKDGLNKEKTALRKAIFSQVSG